MGCYGRQRIDSTMKRFSSLLPIVAAVFVVVVVVGRVTGTFVVSDLLKIVYRHFLLYSRLYIWSDDVSAAGVRVVRLDEASIKSLALE